MSIIAFVWSSKDLKVWESTRINKAVTRAMGKAGSDGLRAMRPQASRQIRAKKRFKVKKVNKGLPLIFPSRGTELRHLSWTMGVSGEAVALIDLPHRKVRRGISVAVNKGKRKVLKGGFIARMKSGHEGIFRRMGKKHLPIREAFTTRLSDVMQDPGAADQVLSKGVERMKATLDRVLPLELEKLKR